VTGAADQAANGFFVSDAPGWTTDHRLRGIAYVAVRLEYNGDIFPLGIPNVSAVVKGKKVYDPRTDTTAWSENAALCIRDYMTSDYGFGCDADEIDDAYFIAAANVCDEGVALSGGGTQDRYTCNGVVDTASAPLDNLASLVTSLAGAVTYVQGKFRLHAGAYDSPSGTITTDMLAGPVRAELRTARKELFNAVKGTYVDPDKSWQPTDFPFVTNATYEGQDNGERIYTDIDLPFTNDPEAAQRIAKIVLEKARQGIQVEMPLNHSAMKFAVYDTLNVTNVAFGWSSKVFRILKVTADGTGLVILSLQEETSASYDWNSGEASTVDAAPDTNLPDPTRIAPPGAPQVAEQLYVTTDGSGVKAKAVVTWGESSEMFVREYQLEYSLAADTDYTRMPRTEATTQEVLDLAPGSYQFRVKAISTLGVSSPYSPVTPKVMAGLTAAPGDVQNLSLNVIGNAAHLSWNQATDIDVVNGGWVRFRYSPDTSGPAWNAAVDIGPALPGVSTSAVLPLLAGTYMAKFVDSSGNASVNAATVTTNAVSLLELNVVETISEHPDFAGDKDGVVYDSTLGGIKLTGGGRLGRLPRRH
jgi:predicted phage tail protein